MDLSMKPDVSVSHGLHLTTELAQGIQVLQMNASDLSEYVRDCVGENPFFDEDASHHESTRSPEDSCGGVSSSVDGADDPGAPFEGRKPDEVLTTLGASDASDVSDGVRYRRDVSTDELFERRGHGSPERFGNERPDMAQRSFSFDRFLVERESLEDHLLEQLHISSHDDQIQRLGEYLIGCLDASGYLRVPLSSVAEELGCEEELVARALEVIWSFDPVGVGARDLSECIRIQLEARGALTPLLDKVLSDHLQDFGVKTPAAIARCLGVTLVELTSAMDVVRTCNPRPGSQFGGTSRPIWPEVVVEAAPEGGYEVWLQDFYLPELKINERYRTLALNSDGRSSEEYLKRKLKEAEGLLSGIRYRHATLRKVACAIVELQKGFFDEGFEALRPLTMAHVAEVSDVSESTVSRLVNGNYMQTPRGVFELRFFFSSSASSKESGEGASSLSVKRRIADLVAKEDPAKPLSDQAISDALAKAGISISRRTVNKYRDDLGIPARAARRRC